MMPYYRCQDGWNVLVGVDKENFVAYKKQGMKKKAFTNSGFNKMEGEN
jgi:hypothetical protein